MRFNQMTTLAVLALALVTSCGSDGEATPASPTVATASSPAADTTPETAPAADATSTPETAADTTPTTAPAADTTPTPETAVDTAATPVTSDGSSEKPLGGRDACDVVSAGDVEATFGGSVSAGPKDSVYSCHFLVDGETLFGSTAPNTTSHVTVGGAWPGSLASSSPESLGEPLTGSWDEGYLLRLGGEVSIRVRVGTVEFVVAVSLTVEDQVAVEHGVTALAEIVADRVS